MAYLSQGKFVELFPIFGDNRVWDSKPTDNVSSDEVRALDLGDCGGWFGLHPLGEIVNRYNGEFGLCSSSYKWADQVYPSF